MLQYGGHAR